MKWRYTYLLYKKEWFLCLVLILLAIMLVFSGCYSHKIAKRQIIRAQAEYPNVLASACGSFYTPSPSVRDSYIYKQGEVEYLPADTVWADCDTVVVNTIGKKLVALPCPPASLRMDTLYISRVIERENKAQIITLQNQLTEQQLLTARKDTLLKIVCWIVAILSAYTLARFIIKRFTGFSLP
jgi:uncharacterized protein YceK